MVLFSTIMTSRAQAFEDLVETAQTVINELDPRTFHPDIAAAVASLNFIVEDIRKNHASPGRAFEANDTITRFMAEEDLAVAG